MKTRILALAAVVVLALAAVAVAKTNTLTGKLKLHPEGKVKVKVTVKKGVVKKVTAINVTNFPSNCSNQRGDKVPGKTATAKLGSFKITKTKSGGKTYYSVTGGRKVDGNQFNMEAAFSSKKGRKITGTLSFNYHDPNPNGGGTCDGGGRFSAKVK